MPESKPAPVTVQLTEINGNRLTPHTIVVEPETEFFAVIMGETPQAQEEMSIIARFADELQPGEQVPAETSEIQLCVRENFRLIQLSDEEPEGIPGFKFKKLAEILIRVASNAIDHPLMMETLSDGREI